MKTKILLGLIYSYLLGSSVIAGTQAVMQSSQKSVTLITVEGNKLRIENQGNENSIAIFDTDKKEMLMIDQKERSYMRMDKTSFDKIKQQLDKARKQMEAQMANMPPQQREMIQKMMGDKLNMFSTPKANKTKFVETGRTDKAAGYTCKVTEYFVNDKKKTEFCVTPQSEIKGAKDIYQAMKNMSAMFNELYQSLSQSFPMISQTNPFSEIEKLGGYPLIITDFDSGAANERNELRSLESRSFNKSLFLPPKGFREKKMEMPEF
jgi:hypothetical protein